MLSPVRQVVVTPARGCTEWPQAPPPITQPFKYDELNRATNSEPPRWSLIASPSFTELFNEIRKSMPIELVKSAVNARQQFIVSPSPLIALSDMIQQLLPRAFRIDRQRDRPTDRCS
jgi:hypothetical protein